MGHTASTSDELRGSSRHTSMSRLTPLLTSFPSLGCANLRHNTHSRLQALVKSAAARHRDSAAATSKPRSGATDHHKQPDAALAALSSRGARPPPPPRTPPPPPPKTPSKPAAALRSAEEEEQEEGRERPGPLLRRLSAHRRGPSLIRDFSTIPLGPAEGLPHSWSGGSDSLAGGRMPRRLARWVA